MKKLLLLFDVKCFGYNSQGIMQINAAVFIFLLKYQIDLIPFVLSQQMDKLFRTFLYVFESQAIPYDRPSFFLFIFAFF